MDRVGKLSMAAALSCGLTACPSSHKGPPPPDESAEIASAAPKALGALAGGTDAAPPVVLSPRRSMGEDPDGIPIPAPDPDAGAEPPDAAAAGTDELPL